jgi:hypothetical protein
MPIENLIIILMNGNLVHEQLLLWATILLKWFLNFTEWLLSALVHIIGMLWFDLFGRLKSILGFVNLGFQGLYSLRKCLNLSPFLKKCLKMKKWRKHLEFDYSVEKCLFLLQICFKMIEWRSVVIKSTVYSLQKKLYKI